MPISLSLRLVAAQDFLVKLWRLTRPYWYADTMTEVRVLGRTYSLTEAWIARGLLALVIGLSVFLVYLSKLFNDWNGRFFNALNDRNAEAFWLELKYWVLLVAVYIVAAVYALWLRQLLTIRWRRWLSEVYVRDWLANRTYYRMELVGRGADNPEQRIEQDCNSFTTRTLSIVLGLISEVLTFGTFAVVLWNLSRNFTFPGTGVVVPGYMMWVALAYAVIGSWLTYVIGRRLVRINFDLERHNADYRFRMSRLRENAESVALYRGEADEERRLGGSFGRIYDTWWDYMKYNKRLTWLTAFYAQAAGIFPLLVGAPYYFSNAITLGVLTQMAGAFGNVQGALSWFVNSYPQLAEWKAVVDRLTTFNDAMAAAARQAAQGEGFAVESAPGGRIKLEQADVLLPNGEPLLADASLEVRQGERVVLTGASGSGKTTLFRVLAGLWPFGRGRVTLPEGARVLFLPQKPYLPMGTLKEVLCFPAAPDAYDDAAAREALEACALPHLADRLGKSENWSLALSVGEQQRLAFARALLYRPDWLFLDEATSALDEAAERRMYELMRERLPRATLISIAHRPTAAAHHERRLTIEPHHKRVVMAPVGT
jgi:putative ATP-binding cassette transporter